MKLMQKIRKWSLRKKLMVGLLALLGLRLVVPWPWFEREFYDLPCNRDNPLCHMDAERVVWQWRSLLIPWPYICEYSLPCPQEPKGITCAMVLQKGWCWRKPVIWEIYNELIVGEVNKEVNTIEDVFLPANY